MLKMSVKLTLLIPCMVRVLYMVRDPLKFNFQDKIPSKYKRVKFTCVSMNLLDLVETIWCICRRTHFETPNHNNKTNRSRFIMTL